jgi:hypothetical protein
MFITACGINRGEIIPHLGIDFRKVLRNGLIDVCLTKVSVSQRMIIPAKRIKQKSRWSITNG